MKRVLFVFLVCAIFVLPVSAAAAEMSSLIGKRIQRVLPIKVGNERAPTDAIVIDGVSYAPVRAVAEMLGADVDFQNGEIIITPKGGTPMTAGKAITAEESSTAEENQRQLDLIAELKTEKALLESDISAAQKRIDSIRSSYNWAAEMIERLKASTLHSEEEKVEGEQKFRASMAEMENEIATLESEIESKRQRIAEIEAQLEELNAQ